MSSDPATFARPNVPGLTRCRNWSFVLGCAALIVCIAGAVLASPAQFFRAWLAAYVFFLGLGLGGMAILMLYHLTGGAWGYIIRRVLEAQASTVPLLAILFIPIAVGMPELYLWAQPHTVASDPRLHEQQFYLNPTFFVGRVIVYFIIWLLTAAVLLLRTRRQDRTGDSRMPWKLQRAGEVGLVLYGTTLHFAAFDWLSTLQPNFHSTIFPLLVAAGQVLTGQALAIAVVVLILLRTEAAEVVSTRALNDLGNILFAFLILWGYMVWFQYMLIWIANLPSDVLWYAPRGRDGWQWVAWTVFVVQFAIPMFLLLLRSVKCNPRAMLRVTAAILFMQLVYDYYLVMPPFQALSLSEHWMDFFTPVAIGGLWLSWFLHRLERVPVLVRNDPNRESALHLRHLDDEDLAREQVLAHS